jgi:hypothetical protein
MIMSIVDKISIRQNWGEKYVFEVEHEYIPKKTYTSEWEDKEWLAKDLENLLCYIARGKSTDTSYAVTGEEYLTFAGNGVKNQGDSIDYLCDTCMKAWTTFREGVYNYYACRVIFANSKIYWRKKPELATKQTHGYADQYAFMARLLVSDQ